MKYGYKLLIRLVSGVRVLVGKSAVLSQVKTDEYLRPVTMACRAVQGIVGMVHTAKVLQHHLGKAWMRV